MKTSLEKQGYTIPEEEQEYTKSLFRLTSTEKICKQTLSREKFAYQDGLKITKSDEETKHHNIDWEGLIPQFQIIRTQAIEKEKWNHLNPKGSTMTNEEEFTTVLPEHMIKIEIA